MAKHISQETFDGVVRENMEEFDMSAQEAMDEAVQQFEAQGVDLNSIIRDVTLFESGAGDKVEHPVIAAVTTTNEAVHAQPIDTAKLTEGLSQMKVECDKDLAHRCLAGKNNAYSTLMEVQERLSHEKNEDLLLAVFDTLCSLCDGQPDLLDSKGVNFVTEILRKQTKNPKLTYLVVRFVKLTCTKHESNRQTYVENDIIPLLASLLNEHKEDSQITKEVCRALRMLIADDDVRVPFGKGHEHAKMIVTEAGALGKIMDICKAHKSETSVMAELFATLSRLAVRNEFCQEIMDLGGVQLMIDALKNNNKDLGIVKQGFGVLKTIAGNDSVKDSIVIAGGVELVVHLVSQHQRQARVCEVGCATLAMLALRCPAHCQCVMDAGGAEVIVKSMQIHSKEIGVQRSACMAVRNVVARSQQYCAAFLELGAEAAIRVTLATHPQCEDEAKGALRDLQCEVDLKVLWKGEGKGVKR